MDFTIKIANDLTTVKKIVDFFIKNKTTEFISQGEIISGRAHNATTWNENLDQVLLDNWKKDNVLKVVIQNSEEEILGFAILEIIESSLSKHLIVDDIIIGEELRGHSLGEKTIDFIIDFAKKQQIKSLLCESGINNTKAHKFIKRLGFQETSINFQLPIE